MTWITRRIRAQVRALREGGAGCAGAGTAKEEAARELGSLAYGNDANRVRIAKAGGIPRLVDLLCDGSAYAKSEAACALYYLAFNNDNKVLIAEAGGIAPLVDLLRDGSASAKLRSARALGNLAHNNDANKVAVAVAGGIPPLVELLRDGSARANLRPRGAARPRGQQRRQRRRDRAGRRQPQALVELARRGRVTVDNRSAVLGAGVPAKRKAALVVAALIRDYVPEFKSAPRDIKGLIGTYL
ncbi:hypothetical protein JL720_11404 [Aureococcus anophagefferens]|nr:hypothetical protein JL720_11404 [Aureococcus anophagefferens]